MYVARNSINHILLQRQIHKYTLKRNLIINYEVMYKEPLIYLSYSSRKRVFNEMTLMNTQNRHVKDQW